MFEISWTPPSPRRGWAGALDRSVGPGATASELMLQFLPAAIAAVAVPVFTADRGLGWTTAQTLVAALLAFDTVGGVLTNATSAAKRWYHREGRTFVQHLGFASVHALQLFLVAWLFRGMDWFFFGVYFLFLMSAATIILVMPRYLQRPVAFLLLLMGLFLARGVTSPTPGMNWFIPLFFLKLLICHLLPEAPFRPQTGSRA